MAKKIELDCDGCGRHVEPLEQNTNSTPTATIAKQEFDLCPVCGALLLLALRDRSLRKKLE